ncbi:MAG: hypothetical protein AAF990_02675 [Bacteroidota bacterium]
MRSDIERIFLSGLTDQEQGAAVEDGRTDVVVSFRNGDRYVASFFSYDAIAQMREAYRVSGEFMSGRYLWYQNMLLVEECSRSLVEEVIEYLLDEGDFKEVFKKL